MAGTTIFEGKNLTYEQLWGTNGRSFSREGEVRSFKEGL